MRIAFYLLLMILPSCAIAQAQDEKLPRIIFLNPIKGNCEPALIRSTDSLVQVMKDHLYERFGSFAADSTHKKSQEQITRRREARAYIDALDRYRLVSLTALEMISMISYYRFGLLETLADSVRTGSRQELQQVAQNRASHFVVSFPGVSYYQKSGKAHIAIELQLYDSSSNSIVLRKEYKGMSFEPQPEAECEDETLDCLIRNAVAEIASDVLSRMAEIYPDWKSKVIRHERDQVLREQRESILAREYANKPWDGSLARRLISADPYDSTIDLSHMHYQLQNEEKTKFLAFFVRQLTPEEQKEMYIGEGRIDTIVLRNKDTVFSESGPACHGYIVKGMYHSGKWYYLKSHAIYYSGQTVTEGRVYQFQELRDWEFFNENDTTYNRNFWESGLFGKVADLTKHPDWEKYKSMWNDREERDREYIGMYEIVAEWMQQDWRRRQVLFAQDVLRTYIRPLIDAKGKEGIKPMHRFDDEDYEIELIHPKDMRIAICPVTVTTGQDETWLRYYVIIPGTKEIYEWTYFAPVRLGDTHDTYISGVMLKQLPKLTTWDFSKEVLNDENFWNKYVLLKENGRYKYLKPVR